MTSTDERSAGEGVSPNRLLPEVVRHLAQGEAALMLIECLMLILIERRVFTSDEMIEVVETGIDAKRVAGTERANPQIACVVAGMLSTLTNSLAAAE